MLKVTKTDKDHKAQLSAPSSNAAQAEFLYERAVLLAAHYPESQRAGILSTLQNELDNYRTALKLRAEGKIVREIQDEVCKEARSWLKGNIPAAILRYSNSQISESELKKRRSQSSRLMAVCKKKIADARETVTDLEERSGQKMPGVRQQLEDEYKKYKHAFDLYQAGFSQREIKTLANVSIQSRIEEETLPQIIVEYGGLSLSETELKVRQGKVDQIKQKAADGFRKAEELQAGSGEKNLAALRVLWQQDLKNIDLVCRFYLRGLSVLQIATLTGLPASNWLSHDQLPVKLARAALDKHRRDFVIPKVIDANVAYVMGAFFASRRKFSSENDFTVRSRDLQVVTRFKDVFEKTFRTKLRDVRLEGEQHALMLARDEFIKDWFALLQITDGSDPKVPVDILKYQDLTAGFLRGYFSFARGSVNTEHHRVSIIRGQQDNILKALAIGLYFNNIYPLLMSGSDRCELRLSEIPDVRKFLADFPDFGDAAKRAQLKAALPEKDEFLTTYAEYTAVMGAISSHFPPGVRLDFEKVLKHAGPDYLSHGINTSVRGKLQRWRNGEKPLVAQRVDAIKGYIRELYPEL